MSKPEGVTPSIHTARQMGVKRKPGSVYGDIVRGDTIEIDGCIYPINTKQSGIHSDWMRRLVRHTAAKVDEFGRALIVRVDLRQSEYTPDNAQLSQFLAAMTKQIDRKYDHKMGYAWAREQEKAKAQHYHLFLILDADRVQWGPEVYKLAAKVWSKMGGEPWSPRDPHLVVGRGGAALHEATHWLSYLAKPRGKGYRADYTQDFGTGRETIKPRRVHAAKIVRVRKASGVLRTLPKSRAGLSDLQLDEIGMRETVAKAWGVMRSLSGVAEQFNVCPVSVWNWTRDHLPGELENWVKLAKSRTAARRAKGLAMLERGAMIKDVSEALKVHRYTVWHWIESSPGLAAARRERLEERASRREQGIAMLRAGASTGEVAAALNTNSNTVVTWRKAAGLPVRGGGARKGAAVKAEAVALREGGASLSQIAGVLDVPASTLSRWLKGVSSTDTTNGSAA